MCLLGKHYYIEAAGYTAKRHTAEFTMRVRSLRILNLLHLRGSEATLRRIGTRPFYSSKCSDRQHSLD